MKNIVLIGLMGSGKTTVANALKKALVMPMIDLDQYLEEKYQQTIPEMFAISEEYFRQKETEVCKEVGNYTNHIISTGGGVVENSENMKYLKQNSIVIYLERPIEQILEDIQVSSRPLLKDGPEVLYALHTKRHPLYIAASDIQIKNDGSVEQVVEKIVSHYKK